MLNGRRFTTVPLKVNVYANHLGSLLNSRFWASRFGMGTETLHFLIMLITLEKPVSMRTVSVGSSLFYSLMHCYFLALRLSHTDLLAGPWSHYPRAFALALHAAWNIFFTALFMAGCGPNAFQLLTTYSYLHDKFLSEVSPDHCFEKVSKGRLVEREAFDWKTWRWKQARWLPGENIPGTEKCPCKGILPGVWLERSGAKGKAEEKFKCPKLDSSRRKTSAAG